MSKKITFVALIACICFLSYCNSQTPSQNYSLRLTGSIPLPNVKGRIDHMAFDSKRQYVYIAALGNNIVEVIDLKNNKTVHSITGLREPQGVVCIPESNLIFVTNGNTGVCDFFDADTFIRIKSIKLSGDADNVRYDSMAKRIYVGFGTGGMAVIDAVTLNLVKEIKLSGHPESFQIDKTAKKVYVNIPFQNQIEVIDLEKNLVTDSWKLTQASSNFPMCLDETNHRVFIGCRHPAKLLVIDTENGKTLASFDIDNDVDDIYYDKQSQLIYLSCGAGYADVFKQVDANTYTAKGKTLTHPGARTSLFVPELNELIVASPASFSAHASLLIYSTK